MASIVAQLAMNVLAVNVTEWTSFRRALCLTQAHDSNYNMEDTVQRVAIIPYCLIPLRPIVFVQSVNRDIARKPSRWQPPPILAESILAAAPGIS
jgi:hypothetical protein